MVAILFCGCDDDNPIAPQKQDPPKILIINFETKVDTQILEFDTKKYITLANDTFSVQNFKFYIMPLGLYSNTDSVKFLRQFYTLIDPKNNKNQMVITVASDFNFSKLKLAIGVDSVNNHRIDFTGDLDPNNDMAWDWNTGYKFLLLEGSYWGQTSNGPLVYHIGTDAKYRVVNINLGQSVSLKADKNPSISLNVNINGIFEAPNLIDLDINNNEMFGSFSQKIADNYAQNLLSLKNIKQ